ncbi:Protein pellino [Trichinella spiralis]|uniref:Protein pellino n=1 Tax=Trichinella spiralis TaxID=6334 RepID=A0ABR3KTR1_TRISP|nr:Protein pellino [Trichinella sp. T8]
MAENAEAGEKYGELIVLGYNGLNAMMKNRACRSKFELLKRDTPNGIAKSRHYVVGNARHYQQKKRLHSVMYTLNRHEMVVVEYVPDNKTDMFQIGRSSEEQIDFTVMDTWLGRSFLNSGIRNGDNPPQSTISRYACRILIHRKPPYEARVYAAGFDSCRNIFLGERATKWRKESGELDGLTTNGILILHPQKSPESSLYAWYEVSVDGDLFALRPTRSTPHRGEKVETQSNVLQDGTLIDLCGATLLYRTAYGLSESPTSAELDSILNQLNAGRPQCPVNLNTLIIPKQKSVLPDSPEKQPYVYLTCGHVQGYHSWGHSSETLMHICPICKTESSDIVQLCMGMEPAFHLDSGKLDHAFIPCGHMASSKTVRYWSRIPLPHGTSSFHPVCPFCTVLLSPKKPFVKLIFQDNCF